MRRVAYPDERINSILTGIEKVNLEVIADQEFIEQDVYLDGRHFKNCAFIKCRMFIKLGYFFIEGPRIQLDGCTFNMDGPAGRVHQFVETVKRMQGQ